MTSAPILIKRDEVRQLLDWDAVKHATRQGLKIAASADPSTTVSAQLLYAKGSLHLKAAALEPQRIISVKSNLRPNAGGVSGVLLAYDLFTEQLSGIIDAGLMTALRTGAIAAIAAERFCVPGRVSVAVLGVGPVGSQSIQGLLRVLDVAQVRLWSNHGLRAQQLATELASGVDAVACQNVSDAIANVDVIITATPATEPILDSARLPDGALILAMGADTAGKRELSPGVLYDSDLVADAPDDALRIGECAHMPESRQGSVTALGYWLDREGAPPREHQYLIVDSVGSSHVDAAVTSVIMARAAERGIGRPVQW